MTIETMEYTWIGFIPTIEAQMNLFNPSTVGIAGTDGLTTTTNNKQQANHENIPRNYRYHSRHTNLWFCHYLVLQPSLRQR